MKRRFLFLTALCLAIAQAWGQTTVASGTCGAEGDGTHITWTLTDDGTLTLSGTGAVAHFTSSTQPWQAHLSAIRTAVVGEGVTGIGDWFLGNCFGLASITLPAGLTSVGDYFLIHCSGLTSITLPDGLTSVGNCFLYGCTGLTSLTLPGGLTSTGDYFLSGCRGLTALTLPEGLESAGDYFLRECTGLKELTVPVATPPAVGSNGAFNGVSNTIPVYVPAGSIPAYAGTAVWSYFTDYRPIPVVVASGTCGAEGDGNNITWTLTDDGTLTLSGTGAVAHFTYGAQPWQTYLTTIHTAVIGDGITRIGDNFLYGCPSLDSITLPDGLKSAGNYFLYECRELTALTLPGGLTSAGAYFLNFCESLTSLTLPDGLESVGDYFLSDCTGLTSLTLPDGLTSVGNCFLYSCRELTALILPGGLTGVGDYFLSSCMSLTSIELPAGLRSVGDNFLRWCTGLTALTLPEGLESAGDYFLSDCTGLKELTVPVATPPAVGSNGAFNGVSNTIPVYVPAGSIPAYAGTAVWSYFTDYRPIPTVVASGTCGAEGDGSNITWVLTADSTLTLSGTGAVADFTENAQPWQAHLSAIRTAVVGEGVTGIGDWFLSWCESLTSVTLPEGLESVGEGFLAYCTSLTSLTLPGGLTGVGDGFLSDCRGLTSVTLPAGLTGVGHGFLYGCTALASVTLPEGLESAGDTFLSGCTSLTSLTLPEGLESVGSGFLSWCSSLASLTLPEGLTVAGDGFLYGCTGLEELTVLAATPPSIGSENAFEDVDNAIPVYVPAGSIEAYKTAAVWSYFTDYRPLGSTGIGTPSLAGSVTVAGGEVRLHLAGNPTIYIYDMQGRHLLTTTEHRIALPQGSYIIKVGREAVKVAL